ncbi:MAG: hypothetical protein KDB22_02050 [Planctomycetales bacterium]|nr:hypothetical protein [Planctomycetales bacterium]
MQRNSAVMWPSSLERSRSAPAVVVGSGLKRQPDGPKFDATQSENGGGAEESLPWTKEHRAWKLSDVAPSLARPVCLYFSNWR